MTAEIALLNREAVALAADSAVTMRTRHGTKVLQSANKIFTLSKYHPVGVMLYGNAQLLETPWELVIKSYRKQLGAKSFSRLEDYAKDLIRFVSESRALFPEEAQASYVTALVTEAFSNVRDVSLEQIEVVIKEK